MIALRALIRISFLEFLRDRIVWICFLVGVVLFGFSLILGSLSIQEQQRIMAHFGWMALQLSGLGIGLFLGANWVHKEMDHQTCLLVLARPVSRAQFFLGKYLSVLSLLFMIELILAVFLFGLLRFKMSPVFFLQVFVGTFLEVALIFSLTFFAATFLRPAMAFLWGVGFFLMGHWMQEVEFFGQKTGSAFYFSLGKGVSWFCPNLYQMNWRTVYFLEHGVSETQVLWVLFHSLGWLLLTAVAGILIFRRKDLV
ncbi:MAG: ABC transporter permease [Bdellovibrio sp. CG10_big_fil_rev_8_21_14_0_10_47_8]|nr:MAG: ABC transporter permease [Bdellovibrio sp. CG10_big_fil_rev_8_21_14_0_10_47_8]